jgi:hypothetical protein
MRRSTVLSLYLQLAFLAADIVEDVCILKELYLGLLPQGHDTGHLLLRDLDLPASVGMLPEASEISYFFAEKLRTNKLDRLSIKSLSWLSNNYFKSIIMIVSKACTIKVS